MGLAFRDLFLHFWVPGSLGSSFRVMGSLGSPFSAAPADPGVGKGRQGSRFRNGRGMANFINQTFLARLGKIRDASHEIALIVNVWNDVDFTLYFMVLAHGLKI